MNLKNRDNSHTFIPVLFYSIKRKRTYKKRPDEYSITIKSD